MLTITCPHCKKEFDLSLKCLRCGHAWLPRNIKEKPKFCPKCKSPYWDRPRRREKLNSVLEKQIKEIHGSHETVDKPDCFGKYHITKECEECFDKHADIAKACFEVVTIDRIRNTVSKGERPYCFGRYNGDDERCTACQESNSEIWRECIKESKGSEVPEVEPVEEPEELEADS